MRTITQLAVLAVIGGAGAAWHFHGDKVGLKPPLEMLGLQAPPARVRAGRSA
jgi:membrane fusion protein (multidrug efflux system)